MNKSKLAALLLTTSMVVMPTGIFAADTNGNAANIQGESDKTASVDQQSSESTQNNEAKNAAVSSEKKDQSKAEENEGSTVAKAPAAPAANQDETTAETASNAWTAEDFTYGSHPELVNNNAKYPASQSDKELKVDELWVVTGLSDSGKAKLENNKDLVIPSKDPDGRKIQGIGNSAFKGLNLTSIKLPETEKVDNTVGWTGGTSGKEAVPKRGDFVIGENAFSNNNLTSVDLPEGLLLVNSMAFANNKTLTSVTFPKSMLLIAGRSFYGDALQTLNFPEETDFRLSIDAYAFMNNKIQSVQLPKNIEKCSDCAFVMNTGKETPAKTKNPAEKKSGVVYLYINTDNISGMVNCVNNETSNTQKVLLENQPISEQPWKLSDFTFDEAGTTITGLTDNGKEKIKTNPNLVLPDKNAKGENIIGIGNGTGYGKGVFAVTDGDNYYSPETVKFPANLETIGNFAFSENPATQNRKQAGLIKAEFPNTLKSIGNTAFNNNRITEVILPDSLTSLGQTAFGGNAGQNANTVHVTKLKLSKNLKTIPDGAFVAQRIETIEIPEGVTTIGSSAFAGNRAKSVTIPNTVTSIGQRAFQNEQFTEVDIPGSVKTIGNYAFEYTNTNDGESKLTKVTLHEGTESIGKNTFAKNKITEVNLPTTLTTLDRNAFTDNDQKVKVHSTVPEQIAGNGKYSKVVINGTGHYFSYVITLDSNGEKLDNSTVGTNVNGTADLPKPTIEEKGKEFDGWYTSKNGGDKVKADTKFDKDTTLYAHYNFNHSLKKVDAKDPTCTEAGNKEYWICDNCGKLFSDAEGKTETTKDAVTLKATGHKLTKHDAKDPTCTEAGNKEYWTCDNCGKLFSDAEGKTETTQDAVTLKVTGHNKLTKHDAKDPTCTEAGNKEYWTCDNCGKLFSDAEDKTETTRAAVTLKATGHDWDEGKATKEPTTTEEGVKTFTCKNDPSHVKTEVIAKLTSGDSKDTKTSTTTTTTTATTTKTTVKAAKDTKAAAGVKTGDESSIVLPAVVLIAGAAALVTILHRKKGQ